MLNPFQAMQKAVDIVNDSEHIKNKIAACLFQTSPSSSDLIGGSSSEGNPLVKPKDDVYIARYNHRPDRLKNKLSPDKRIGDSSQFLHAEVACIFAADFPTEGASLCITDPFCPNCAKAISEAGIAHVYIDHKGIEKDFFVRRRDVFEALSLNILRQEGIGVAILNRKKRTYQIVLEPQKISKKETDLIILKQSDNSISLSDLLKKNKAFYPDKNFAIAFIKDREDQICAFTIFEKSYDSLHDVNPSDKYSVMIDPVNRLLYHCARHGYQILNQEIATNITPSNRAIVNAIGYNIHKIISTWHDTEGSNRNILNDLDIISVKSC
jgi:dCMP deaminase